MDITRIGATPSASGAAVTLLLAFATTLALGFIARRVGTSA